MLGTVALYAPSSQLLKNEGVTDLQLRIGLTDQLEGYGFANSRLNTKQDAQALTVTWVSETLCWLLSEGFIFADQQTHHRININQQCPRETALLTLNTIAINVLYIETNHQIYNLTHKLHP